MLLLMFVVVTVVDVADVDVVVAADVDFFLIFGLIILVSIRLQVVPYPISYNNRSSSLSRHPTKT